MNPPFWKCIIILCINLVLSNMVHYLQGLSHSDDEAADDEREVEEELKKLHRKHSGRIQGDGQITNCVLA